MNEKANLTVLVSSKCNLKCKLCATYSPQQGARARFYDLEKMKRSIDRFFEAMGSVRLLTFSGGEPLLHPQLPELLKHCQQYIDRVEKFEIITNGTIVPNDKLIEILRFSDKVDLLVDNYGPSISKKVAEIDKVLNENNITHRIRKYYGEDPHLNGWIDTSDFSPKNRTEEEIHEVFARCNYMTVFKNSYLLFESFICLCYVNHTLVDSVEDDKTQYIDMCDESIDTDTLKKQLLSFRDRYYLKACTNCLGSATTDPRQPPAEQL
jgi:organic radical activating enzyme